MARIRLAKATVQACVRTPPLQNPKIPACVANQAGTATLRRLTPRVMGTRYPSKVPFA
ncbi:hypothetical protein THS5294_03349 [Thalassobacter stenotrophicus]|uniref:Uncharacterized protein n=2 Tax=Thalassobacter stenotrophicus TaxID=266809 RepID=A0A0P1F323_9RHOB|nr:hypothetical protein THS5294_03349 [Thalassobacter stenotrophicus]SHI36434.1 hypothetical protein SAMN02744035_00283 [Thalassobacter stenotrophicus DSM 16310]